ncbi:MAG: neutral/alkaline non-lysosomal ceramidase N-terminal domain-containing protein [Verrucomicrobiales bacterium]|nr:neutral/alkaline non-lysosomal ceramidase N-terminal domain-containing protein [Verrucomicrobiales bacterium]
MKISSIEIIRTIRIIGLIILFGLWQRPIIAKTESKANVQVGVAKVDVTPKEPVVLAGYGGRTKEFDGIDSSLWARCMVIGRNEPAVIVVVDNCGVPGKLRSLLAKRLSKHGIPEKNLVVSATHTHNAPNLRGYAPILWAGRASPDQEKGIDNYTNFLIDKMETVVAEALKKREPMQLGWSRGMVQFGGNRRLIREGKWAGFGFQRNGPVDHSLPVLVARDLKGNARAVWANYACHCTTVGSRNHVGGDWAGYANEMIEKEFKSAVSLMTIGCGADVGPQPSGGLEDAKKHGSSIAKEVKNLLEKELIPLPGVTSVTGSTAKLPLVEPSPRKHWEAQKSVGNFHGELAKEMLSQLDSNGKISSEVDYPIQSWKFGDQLAMVFLAGEVVVDYSVRLNRELDWKRLWISAWSNDMPGYIPSKRVLKEGGYEAEFSQVYYGLPGPYLPEVEDTVVSAVTDLLKNDFGAKEDQDIAPFHSFPSLEPSTFKRIASWLKEPKSEKDKVILAKVRKCIRSTVPVDAAMISGQGQRTEWHNFSGDFVERTFIRQSEKGVRISWAFPFNKEKRKETMTLCFLGGLGWKTEPEIGGFRMLINGKDPIQFDVTTSPAVWSSLDKSIELIYLPTWSSSLDSGGFFFVHILNPDDHEISNVKISVSSFGEGSMRWFALDSEQKIMNRLKHLKEAFK